jgi:phage shock protein A
MNPPPFDAEAFEALLVEVRANIRRRTEMAIRLREQGHTQEEFDDVDRVLHEFDQAIRQLRRTMKKLPELLAEAGCGVEVVELRRNVHRSSAAWRELKASWSSKDRAFRQLHSNEEG